MPQIARRRIEVDLAEVCPVRRVAGEAQARRWRLGQDVVEPLGALHLPPIGHPLTANWARTELGHRVAPAGGAPCGRSRGAPAAAYELAAHGSWIVDGAEERVEVVERLSRIAGAQVGDRPGQRVDGVLRSAELCEHRREQRAGLAEGAIT